MDPKSVWSRTFSREGSHVDLPHCCGRGSTWVTCGVCNLGQLGVCAWFHSLLLPSWNLEWFLNKGSRISILHWIHRLCIRSWAAQMELFKNKRPDPPVWGGFFGDRELWWRPNQPPRPQVFWLTNPMQFFLLHIWGAFSSQVKGQTVYEMSRNREFPAIIKRGESKGLWDLPIQSLDNWGNGLY